MERRSLAVRWALDKGAYVKRAKDGLEKEDGCGKVGKGWNEDYEWNAPTLESKIAQAAPCGANLAVSVSSISKIACYIKKSWKEKFPKNSKS